jgi:hypothetical protein
MGLGILANMISNFGSAVMSNLGRLKSKREAVALVCCVCVWVRRLRPMESRVSLTAHVMQAEMDDMIEQMRTHAIPSLQSSRKALRVQNQLMETLKLVAERVIELQIQEDTDSEMAH